MYSVSIVSVLYLDMLPSHHPSPTASYALSLHDALPISSLRVFDAAVEKAYKGKRRVAWYEVFAGEKSKAKFDTWLPDDTVNAIREFRVAIKGPLTTPVGGGIRSLNVTLGQLLALYSCARPL